MNDTTASYAAFLHSKDAARCSREARRALGAHGLSDVRKVTSRYAANVGGGLDDTVRTDVYLSPWQDVNTVYDVMRHLPGVVESGATANTVFVYRPAA